MNIEVKFFYANGSDKTVLGADAKLSYSQIFYESPGGQVTPVYTDFEIKFTVKGKAKGLAKKLDQFTYVLGNGDGYGEKIKLKSVKDKKGVLAICFRGSGDYMLPGFERKIQPAT